MLPTDQEIICYLFGYLCEQEEEDASYLRMVSSVSSSPNLYVVGAISTVVGAAAIARIAYYWYFYGEKDDNELDRVMETWDSPPPEEPTRARNPTPKRASKREPTPPPKREPTPPPKREPTPKGDPPKEGKVCPACRAKQNKK